MFLIFHFSSIEANYLVGGDNRIGREYKKSVYVQYTDETFMEEIPKEDWQGFLGPIVYGEVGDTIEIVFKNLASRPYSIHAHGVLYDKVSEGMYQVIFTTQRFVIEVNSIH